MNPNQSGQRYFEDRVFTASPQELQRMLLESALNAARRAADLLGADQYLRAGSDLAHAEAVTAQILGAMRKEIAPDLVAKASSVYVFIMKALTDAHLTGSAARARDAVRVLEAEHETWRQVCERSESHRSPPPPAHFFSAPSIATTDTYEGGFSLEA